MRGRFLIVAVSLLLLAGTLLPVLAAVGHAAATPWWDAQWPYRTAVTVGAAGYERRDKVAEIPINFTDLLTGVGASGRFNPDSIRVLEISGGNIVDEAVPFQFNRAEGYNAGNNAAGTLLILMGGTTAAAASRSYQVYFGTTGTAYDEPVFPYLVGLGTVTDDYGYEAFRLFTGSGTYYYHKTGGGFASLVDTGNNDWISWNPALTDAGDSRGIPNMVHPNNGGYFHPGRPGIETTGRRGPLAATIRSKSEDKEWATVWDVFPTYARLTVEKVPDGRAYWLLYEGTPGGKLEPGTDLVTRSDGTTATAAEAWTGDIPEEEWAYFTDPALDRSLYLIHYPDDELVDSYTPSTNKLMTVFGFGRGGANRYLTGVSNQMIFGLVDETTLEGVGATVYNVYKPLDVAVGSAEERPFTPTPAPSPTKAATETPMPTATSTPTAQPTETVTPTVTATSTTPPTQTSTPTSSSTPQPIDTTEPTNTPKPTRTPVTTATPKVSPTPMLTTTATVAATATRPAAPEYGIYLAFVARP